ncbi:MAG: RNA polymerase sigma factor [Solirubrobacteraceae bacterium]
MTPIVSATLLRTQSDERLLALTRQGYERAFEAIVERYRRPMMRYCRRYLPEARAEDAVQQAFVSAWSTIRGGTPVVDLRAWLYRITRNAAIDAAKRAGYDYSELSEALRLAPAPEAELERRAVMRETLAGVAALPANQREALLRTVVEGQSRAEIARELQISEGAVRQLIHRARMALRSAATALTPTPVISWAASLGGGDAPVTARISELAAGGGAAGGAGVLIKTGTVAVVAGVLAVEAGTRLDHPSTAAGDSAADRPRAAHVSRVRSHVGQVSLHSRAHGRAATGRSLARITHKAMLESGTAGGSGDDGRGRVNRGPGSVGPIAASLTGESDGAGTETSGSDTRDGSGEEGDREGDNSGPGSETSGSGDGDGDGDHGDSGSSGSDGDADHSGSGSDGGDSRGDKSDSGSDRSGSNQDGGSGDKKSGD